MPFKTKEKEQQWRKDNAEHLRKYRKKWRKTNPHYSRDWSRRNRSKDLYYWYSEEEKDLIREAYIKKIPFENIAKRLGRSVIAVKAKAYQMGLRLKKQWTKKDYEILKTEYEKGTAVKKIADKLETTTKAIFWQAMKSGITSKIGTKEFSEKASKRNKTLWGNPNHIFNQPEYKEKLKARFKDPNNIVNSKEYKQALSDRAVKNKIWLKSNYKGNGRYHGGLREDLGHYVRSRWEANIARYLKWLITQNKMKKYEYEIDCFEFKNIKRGIRSYTPDFKVFNNNGSIEYWEVKGYMDNNSKVKLKRMAKYYPDIKIVLYEREQYKEIEKWSGLIPNWEY